MLIDLINVLLLKLNKSPINLFSENISLKIRTPQVLKNNEEETLYLSELKPDLIVVVSYGQIIPKNLLKIPKYGFLNIHASLLPKWRGAAPLQRSIMNQEEMNQYYKKIHEYLSKTSENLYVESEYLKIKWYCGWCESFIPVDDIEEKRYKTRTIIKKANFFKMRISLKNEKKTI